MINYPDARLKAQGILKMYKISTPPIKVEEVAEYLGFKVVPFDFPENISAITKIIDGVKVIGVNKKHHSSRRRFSVAHELGHFLCGHETYTHETTIVEPEKKYSDPRYQQEKEADEFAAELLMPESMLKIDVLQNRLKAEDIARKYEVSEQALWIQLVGLKLVPGDEFRDDEETF